MFALVFTPHLSPLLLCSVCRGSHQQAVFLRLLLELTNEKCFSEMQTEERREDVSPSLPWASFLAATLSPPWLQLPLKSSSWFQLPSGNPDHQALITSPPPSVPPAVANLLLDNFYFLDWTLTDKISAEILLCSSAVLLGARDSWYLACESSEVISFSNFLKLKFINFS